MSLHTVWMRADLQASQYPSEAMWAKSTMNWALEIASEQKEELKNFKVYAEKGLRTGQESSVALEAQVEAEDFDMALDLLLNFVHHGLSVVSELNTQGVSYDLYDFEEAETSKQDNFVKALKAEFAIEAEPAKPLTEAQKAFQARSEARSKALRENLTELVRVQRAEIEVDSTPSI